MAILVDHCGGPTESHLSSCDLVGLQPSDEDLPNIFFAFFMEHFYLVGQISLLSTIQDIIQCIGHHWNQLHILSCAANHNI